ncbi:integumentary mucin C.1-like [Rhopalosiphum padi]|uniref:integumentary mucin C.1-like n=1 Tax=Rhopalosiphum padi TaxID=40932 RepID=UPI00298E86D6|nr:integumentary mucin C.1-like [Rhopalosiphum padi]
MIFTSKIKMAKFVLAVIVVISLFGSTTKAGLAQRDEPMTIVVDLDNSYPRDEIKYLQENDDLTDNMPKDEPFVNDASVTTMPEEHNMKRSATKTPSVPTNDDQATKSTTRTTTMNTRTTTSTTNSTTVTSTSTPTTMSSTTTTALTISSTSTMSGTRH